MKTYIVLLRGINVGGHKKVPMADLRELLTNSGFDNVRSYIQSGNVVLQSSISDKNDIENRIKKSIHDYFGFEVPVIAKTRSELLRIFDTCPFSEEEKKDSYFVILNQKPKSELIDKASEKTYENEEFKIIDDCLYFYCEKGYGKAKFSLNFFERKLKANATARNYRTMAKLLELSTL